MPPKKYNHVHKYISKRRKEGSESKNLFMPMSFVFYNDNLHVKLSECKGEREKESVKAKKISPWS